MLTFNKLSILTFTSFLGQHLLFRRHFTVLRAEKHSATHNNLNTSDDNVELLSASLQQLICVYPWKFKTFTFDFLNYSFFNLLDQKPHKINPQIRLTVLPKVVICKVPQLSLHPQNHV
jgi:hypothetical protein